MCPISASGFVALRRLPAALDGALDALDEARTICSSRALDHSPSRPSPWRGSSLFNLERGSDGLPVRDMGPQRLKEGARSYIVDGALSQPAPLPCSVARHLLERAEDRE
jgi:hypothetical protein